MTPSARPVRKFKDLNRRDICRKRSPARRFPVGTASGRPDSGNLSRSSGSPERRSWERTGGAGRTLSRFPRTALRQKAARHTPRTTPAASRFSSGCAAGVPSAGENPPGSADCRPGRPHPEFAGIPPSLPFPSSLLLKKDNTGKRKCK